MIKFRKQVLKISSIIIGGIFVSSCASVNVSEYPNITVSEDKKIKSIKFTNNLTASNEKTVSCVKQHVENKEIPIRHSVTSWAAFTIFTLLPDKKDTIPAGDVVISNENGVVKAAGNIELESTVNGRNFLMFLLTVSNPLPGETELLYNNPSIVLEDTGYGKNPGAFPLGSHYRALFEKSYNALEKLSGELEKCFM